MRVSLHVINYVSLTLIEMHVTKVLVGINRVYRTVMRNVRSVRDQISRYAKRNNA